MICSNPLCPRIIYKSKSSKFRAHYLEDHPTWLSPYTRCCWKLSSSSAVPFLSTDEEHPVLDGVYPGGFGVPTWRPSQTLNVGSTSWVKIQHDLRRIYGAHLNECTLEIQTPTTWGSLSLHSPRVTENTHDSGATCDIRHVPTRWLSSKTHLWKQSRLREQNLLALQKYVQLHCPCWSTLKEEEDLDFKIDETWRRRWHYIFQVLDQ